MGMDWHSSGITTSVMGALKRGLQPRARELGIYVCGGRGATPAAHRMNCAPIADRLGLDGDALVRTSRLTARIDNNAIADGFQIYLHTFVLTADGEWAVVQQGLNEQSGTRETLSLAFGSGARLHVRSAHGHRRGARRCDSESGRRAGRTGAARCCS